MSAVKINPKKFGSNAVSPRTSKYINTTKPNKVQTDIRSIIRGEMYHSNEGD